MHYWGDKDVDWEGISNAARFISSYCARYARLGGQSKEKFGTVRYYVVGFGTVSLHQLIYPRYYFSQFPDWLWKLDVMYFAPTLTKLFGALFFRWQKFVYNRAYQLSLKKWPHLRGEILMDADHLEYIVGATRKEGKNTHVLGVNGEIIGTWSQLG